MPSQELTLYTFAMSHFCEKIRWTLDLCGLPFDEKPMTPVFHAVAAWRMGGRGRTSLPILKISHTASRVSFVQDSTRILAWLDRESGPFDLLPRCELAQDVSAIESRFDKVGQDVTRLIYAQAFKHPEKLLSFWSSSAAGWQRQCLKTAWPLVRAVYQHQLEMSPKGLEQAEHRLQQALVWLDGRLSDGRRFLVGNHLTVADVAVAALLAPLACPDEHPVFSQADFKRYMLPPSASWLRDRPALRWVRSMYKQHRTALPTGLTKEAVAAA